MRPLVDLKSAFADQGFAIVADVLDASTVDWLEEATAGRLIQASGRGGARHILRDIMAVRSLAVMSSMREIAEAAVGAGAKPVRGILFDKNPDANWKVIWHQDLTISTRERGEVEGFGPWTEKDGVPHVQPPVALLEQMVAVRVHLDDCTSENGPVRVIPGSHRHGRLSPPAIDQLKENGGRFECTVARGGVLAFHSLLLHASSRASKPAHRRVIHIEYVGGSWASLPGGLAWHEAA